MVPLQCEAMASVAQLLVGFYHGTYRFGLRFPIDEVGVSVHW